MATYTCPKNGCASNDPDWCSECGANMHPDAATGGPAQAGAAAAPMLCPNCGTPRENNGRFCGVCRYNFETGQSYAPSPPAATTPDPAPPAPAAAPPAQDEAAAQTGLLVAGAPKAPWAVLIDFDPTIDPTATPDISRARPRLTFPLDLPEILIGRAGGKGHPEIPVADEGVSSRHARILFDAAGDPFLLDLGSTNGTEVNGVAVTAGLPVALKPDDQIVLGRWTRITLKAR